MTGWGSFDLGPNGLEGRTDGGSEWGRFTLVVAVARFFVADYCEICEVAG